MDAFYDNIEIGFINLEYLNTSCLADLGQLEEINNLTLNNMCALKDLNDLDQLYSIHTLHIEGCNSMINIFPEFQIDSISRMRIKSNNALRSISGFEGITDVVELNIYDNPSIEKMTFSIAF